MCVCVFVHSDDDRDNDNSSERTQVVYIMGLNMIFLKSSSCGLTKDPILAAR